MITVPAFVDFDLAQSNRVTAAWLNSVSGIIWGTEVDISLYPLGLASAIAGIGSTPATLTISQPVVMAANATIPSTLALRIVPGGSITTTGYTLTVNGPFSAGLHRVFLGTGTVTFKSEYVAEVVPEWWHDTAVADWHDAIIHAMRACEVSTGMTLVLHGDAYRSTPLVAPTTGIECYCTSIRGAGGGGGRRTASLTFTASTGSGTKHLDYSTGTAYLRLKDIAFYHATTPAVANNGIGVALPTVDGSYLLFENVWVDGFDIGIDSPTGSLNLYGSFRHVVTNACYSYGARLRGLFNGFGFNACQGGRTVNGPGWFMDGAGAALAIGTGDPCHFEGNVGLGLDLANFSTAVVQAYFEANSGIDLRAANAFGSYDSQLKITNCYFDPDTDKNHKRVWAQQTRLHIEDSRFYRTADTDPPVFFYKPDSQSPLGTDLIVSINNHYYGASISNLSDAYIFYLDAKHPTIRFSGVDPNTLAIKANAGDVWMNTVEAEIPYLTGWRCVQSGHFNANNPAATATTTAGSKTLTLSTTSHQISMGDLIQLAGETFGSGDNFAAVLEAPTTLTVVVDKAAVTGVVAADLTFRAALSQRIYAGMPSISRNNISIASGGTAQLFQAVLPAGQQLAATITAVNGLVNGSQTATSKDARFITTETGGAVASTAVAYANQVDASTAADFTLTLSNPVGSTLRVVAGQATGNTTKFGFNARICANNGNPALAS